MAAIISDKFRILNAQQFLNSLGDDYINEANSAIVTGSGAELSKMYFFIGRPQDWDTTIEIYSKSSTAFTTSDTVYVGTNLATAGFKANVRRVNENSLVLYNVVGTANFALGSLLKASNGTSDTGATALTGVYRFSDENVPVVPADNQKEKYDIYSDLIAAKRITTKYCRTVITRYNWNLIAHPKFDMWKPDYLESSSGYQIGKSTATGASSFYDSKYYVVNSNYEVFKCLYNGQNQANPNGRNATNEPTTSPAGGQGSYDSSRKIYTEPTGTAGYVWKYMYTIPTDDVLKFLSTDFMPIVEATNASRAGVVSAAVDGAIDVALVIDEGSGFTQNGDKYAPIIGDGTGGVVKLTFTSGKLTNAVIHNPGRNYTYGTVPLVSGSGSGSSAIGVWNNVNITDPLNPVFSTSTTIPSTAKAHVEPIISPEGGHGSNPEKELNGKRIMINVRLTSTEATAGGETTKDFPVDNDFRRIGIIKDPVVNGSTAVATASTLNGLNAIKVNGATANYQVDEIIEQTVTGSKKAYGRVVSWVLDSNSTTAGVLKYIQIPSEHSFEGKVRAFESSANAILGKSSGASGTVNTAFADNTVLLGCTFVDGLASPEIKRNSGDIIYIENRKKITRSNDQIEDIKLVIEF